VRKILLFLLLTSFFIFRSGEIRAQTIALLPIAETTADYNGVDLASTDILSQFLVEAGLTLVDDESVRQFIAVNRLRHSGYIDSFTAQKVGRDLNADLVLSVTLCEDGSPGKERFGLVLTALETVNGEVVWSVQNSSSLLQETTLLGVGAPRDGEELKFMILMQVAQRAALELPEIIPLQLSREFRFKLVDLQINPKFVRGESQVECQVKLEMLAEMPARIIFTSGTEQVKLSPGRGIGEYQGYWLAPAADGVYTVSLEIYSDVDSVPVRMQDYASYTVINQAPQLSIELKQGFNLNGVTVFREQVLISTTLHPNRAVSRWQVKITRQDGTVVVNDQMDGELPRDLFWRGWNNKRQHLPDGEYTITVIIWDAAGNRAEASRKASLQSECQPVEAKAVHKGKQNFVRLSTQGDSIGLLSLQWKLLVLLPDGELLMEHSGSSLPVEFVLPDNIDVDFLLFSIDVRDQVGNTFSVVDSRLQLPESGLHVVKAEKWSNDF